GRSAPWPRFVWPRRLTVGGARAPARSYRRKPSPASALARPPEPLPTPRTGKGRGTGTGRGGARALSRFAAKRHGLLRRLRERRLAQMLPGDHALPGRARDLLGHRGVGEGEQRVAHDCAAI